MKGTLIFSNQSLRIPTNFAPAGAVKHVELLDETPAFIRKARRQKATGARLAGLKYEKLVNAKLEEYYGDRYLPGPWIKFLSGNSLVFRTVQPDGLIIDLQSGRITIVEIKLRHTVKAWWQLRQLYQPITQRLFPTSIGWKISVCEVFKWYDAKEEFPESFVNVSDPTENCGGNFKIHRLAV
ncbi:MAG: hypothetical protein L3J79_01375 [Candidatus Marinimicrobia bacterium]|nr:hypothetical protein [Candidatus Neomarinimicrobiota bacterium]